MTIDELNESLLADKDWQSDLPDLAGVIDLLRQHTNANGPINPQSEADRFWDQLLKTWMFVIYDLAKRRLHRPAITVASAFYHRLIELQALDNKRYHKGAPAMYLGRLYHALGEFQPAAWFFVMTIVEDVLSNGVDIQNTLAAKDLRNSFGWSEANIEAIAETALELNTQQSKRRYPEIAVVDLLRNKKLNFPPSAKNESEIPINRTLLDQLIRDLSKGRTKNEKKKSLEFLASYLAITLPAVKIKANVKAFEQGITFEHETDLVVIQHTRQPTYLLEALGRHFLIECKNWKGQVGVGELNHFLAKMRFHGCKCGVIFSRNGLSGDKEIGTGLKYARLTQLRWYHQDGCIVIVIKEAQLREMATGSFGFAELLLQGYESVKFSIPEVS